MKIDKDRLHPLYDQYSNAENRLTHALLHTIGSSPFLFSRFLKNIVGISGNLSGGIFEISTQKVPFSHGDDDQEKVESIPDAWIINEQKGIGMNGGRSCRTCIANTISARTSPITVLYGEVF